MTPDDAISQPPAGEDEALDYRSVSTFAVLGLLLGLVSTVVIFTAGTSLDYTLALAPIPIAGLVVSLVAMRSIAAAPELYTGRQLALAGAVLSALFLIGGVGYGSFVYATEVPEGYTRTSFVEMKPTDQDTVDGLLTPIEVQGLIKEGEKVFIKGYIRPDSVRVKQNLRDFLLVRDNNECCFGDASKVKFFDQIQVRLKPGMTTDFNRGLFRVGGVLEVGRADRQTGQPIKYTLNADYIKP